MNLHTRALILSIVFTLIADAARLKIVGWTHSRGRDVLVGAKRASIS